MIQCGDDIHPEVIRQRLREYQAPSAPLPPGRSFRAAAVMIPLVCIENHWSMLFTRRTDTVPSHKGQVAFPGGAVEPGDRTRADTALRETCEEIGIKPEEIDVLGNLWDFPTITGYVITPIVGILAWPTLLRLEPGEVVRTFSVPLEWLADPRHFEELELNLPDGRVEKVVYFQQFDGEKIWGATARITLNFLKVLGQYPK